MSFHQAVEQVNRISGRPLSHHKRFVLLKTFERAPGLNADVISATEAVNVIVDTEFEVLGGNMTSALATIDPDGGLLLTTAGADGDGAFLLPHLDAKQSAWKTVLWGTENEVRFSADIITEGNIGNAIIWAGLKLTNTDVLITDADQVYVRYENAVTSGNWVCHNSIADTDVSDDTGISVAVTTQYRIEIAIDLDRIARTYINGRLYSTSKALTDDINLIPYVCVEADGEAAAKAIRLLNVSISRSFVAA